MAFCDPEHIVEQLDLAQGIHVADFGAGAGYFSVATAERIGPAGVVYVLDIQQELLTKVTHLAKKHHLSSLVYIHADLETERGSTLSDESVDVVLMVNILFQIEQKQAMLDEAFRILKQGGGLLVVDWKESFGGLGPQPEYVLQEGLAKTLAKDVGFSPVKSIDAGSYHYGLIFKKKHG
jgi:ubiquinone/menaquinone biosynthesis C-methylase UbiE